MGKTSLILELQKSIEVIWWMKYEDFDDMYKDNVYDVAVVDEFKGQRRLQYMNELLQGGPMTLRQKGTQYTKRQNIPFIILSNFSIGDCYPNLTPTAWQTLAARVTVIELKQFIKIKLKHP